MNFGRSLKSDSLEPLFTGLDKKIHSVFQLPPNALCSSHIREIPIGSRVLRRQFLGGVGSALPSQLPSHKPENNTSFGHAEFPEIEKTPGSRFFADDTKVPDVGAQSNKEGGSSPAGPEVPRHRVVVGIPWSPEEFIQKALEVKNPKDMLRGIPEELQCTIDHLCNMHPAEVARHRLENLKRWMSRAKELEPVEARLKELMPRHCREILSNKRLQLFKEMLEASEHEDLSLVSDMSEGFKLSGPIPKCDAFRAKRTSATLTTAALRKLAMTARKGIIHSNKGSGDLELDKATFEATQAELEKGWLYGPLRESDLPDEAVVTRRFGIKQGQKTRPIDNYLESMVNATASAVDTVSLHSAEVIAASIARRMKLLRSSKKSSSLLMKSWDLSKAYKHLPLHETSLSDAFLCVWNPDSKQTLLYGQRVLPFGARSSVHGFCRTSLGIWVIGVSLFLLQWTVFFDDFVGCESPALARTFDLCADGLFSLLGWDIARDKVSNFDTVAKILGLSVDLSDTSLGVVKLSNTENRKLATPLRFSYKPGA